ncbi:MAG: SDR family oxidoreductase [Gomphosphaeria aponina SAG 52.96 = DSM 107014]|uniref:SDR family oxidoreductase n=1 Tax=Gomphosphaeria aponina SAG 52.96 = DSM 107014 TaxID=1521640 RepID=A0A941GSK6_9CHRO|nr:SDR family oxidoreductase [Gomphosphaeria aponina SAG 52.96 = DSM 107014]
MKITPPLSAQVILITGASSGIGAALAETLARNFCGIRLVLAARTTEKLDQVGTLCRQVGADVLIMPTDMSDMEQVKNLAKMAVEHFGRVDVLINNAGYGQMGPVELVPPTAAKYQFEVNFYGPLVLTQALIPVMRNQGGGRIINISSIAGRMAFPAGGLYSASKFALEALSDALRMELKAFNIQVSVIEPGPVITEFFKVVQAQIQGTIADVENTPYRRAFENIEAIEEKMGRLGWSPAKVAEIIIRSLKVKNPRPRYIAATGGNILVWMLTKVLPTWVGDAFWKRFYGIDEVEKQWKERKNGVT